VDLYMDASEAQVNNFGIQTVHVTILGPADSTTLSGTAACASYAGDIGQGGGGSGAGGQGASTSSGTSGSSAGTHYLLVGLTPGEQATAVYTLQADLELLGYTAPMTGVFDGATVRATDAFERANGLPVGGTTTMAFRNAMLASLAALAGS
jgi:peptidoglycan hydrolase-like protein with peptidoglycan-binding domain